MSKAEEGTDRIRGMVVSIPTPFEEDGSLDEAMFAETITFYTSRRANALFVLGPFGQGPAMDPASRRRALEIAVEAAGDTPVLPDIGAVDPFTAASLGSHARGLGVTAVALSAPYYYSDRSPEDLVMHFQMVDAATELPILIVDNQRYQGYPISFDTTARIREAVPRVFGIHPANSGLGEVMRYRSRFGEDFKVFSTPEALMPGILLGQTGTSNPMLSMAIEAGVAFMDAIDRGDEATARAIHLAMLRYLQRMSTGQRWYRSVHLAALRYIGLAYKRFPRWPTVEVPAEVVGEIHAAIDEIQSFVSDLS